MNAIEYLTDNSYHKYPFKDNCSLNNGTDQLPNDAFLDIQIVLKGPAVRAYLANLNRHFDNHDHSWYFDISFIYIDKNGDEIAADMLRLDPSVPADRVMIGANLTNAFIKIVPGPSLVAIAQGTLPSMSFTLSTAELVSNAVILAPPYVSDVVLNSLVTTGNTQNVVTPTAGFGVGDTITLGEGYNMDFRHINNGVQASVVPGAGLGLYTPPVTSLSNVIKNINGVLPDAQGKFTFIADNCFRLIKHAHEIQFKTTCTPKCTEKEVEAFAFYLNRVKDGLLTVGSYANSVHTQLQTAIDNYKAHQRKLSLTSAPYIASETVTTGAGTSYFSFAVGIYDPRKSNLNASLAVTYPGALSYVSKTSVLNTGSQSQPLLDVAGFTDKVLSCKSSIIYEFVLTGASNIAQQDVQMLLTYPDGSAFKYQPVLNSGPFFTVSYSNIKVASNNTINVTVDMFDTAAGIHNTSLLVTLPSGITYTTGSATLNLNNTLTHPSSLSISSTSMNFKNKASLNFMASSTSAGSKNITVTMNPGTAITKTIPITIL